MILVKHVTYYLCKTVFPYNRKVIVLGFLDKLLGKKKQDYSKVLNDRSVYDVCYAFTFLATQYSFCGTSYIKVRINPSYVHVEVWIDKESCFYRNINDLSNPQSIRYALRYWPDISEFIISLACSYSDDGFLQLHKIIETVDFSWNAEQVAYAINQALYDIGYNEQPKYYSHDDSLGGLIEFGHI